MVVFVVLASYFPETVFHNLSDEILNTMSSIGMLLLLFGLFGFFFLVSAFCHERISSFTYYR